MSKTCIRANEEGEEAGPGPSSALARCHGNVGTGGLQSAQYSEFQGSEWQPPAMCHSVLRSFLKIKFAAKFPGFLKKN